MAVWSPPPCCGPGVPALASAPESRPSEASLGPVRGAPFVGEDGGRRSAEWEEVEGEGTLLRGAEVVWSPRRQGGALGSGWTGNIGCR